MTEKDTQAPKHKPFVVEALDGVSGFFRAIAEELRSSPSREEQALEVIYEELEELRGAVQEIKDQDIRDRQVLLETGQRLERLAISTLERVEALERSLKPRDLEEARWLKRVLEWLKYLILLLLAEMAKALYDAGVQEEIYPEIKERLQQLGNRIDQSLDRLEQLIAAPEPPPKPTRDPRSVPATSLEPEMIRIPAGRFIMGSTDAEAEAAIEQMIAALEGSSVDEETIRGWVNAERPQHRLHVKSFHIGKYPVTNAQYAAFVAATGYRTAAEKEDWGGVWTGSVWKRVEGADWRHPHGPGSHINGKGDHPVVQISWYDALAFCKWLNQETGKPYRLPSEAEWEKAARRTDGRIYPWGDQWDASRCNAWEGGKRDTAPVGAYPRGASPYGVLDMAGNVWEWTSSLYKPYPYDPRDGREDPEADGRRVLRGGSFYSDQGLVRCAFRDWGFR